MVGIWFPGLTIPGFRMTKGQLLDVSLLGVGLIIPPVDITFWSEKRVWGSFKLFDTDDIVKPLTYTINLIPSLVWDVCKTKLDVWAEDYYARHSEEKK